MSKEFTFYDHMMYSGALVNQVIEKLLRKKDRVIDKLEQDLDNARTANKALKENYEYECDKILVMERENLELTLIVQQQARAILSLNSRIDKLQQKKTSTPSPWAAQENVSSYAVGERTEIHFDLCTMPTGEEYMDARKYYDGHPTRKGICLSIDDFHRFLTNARIAWSRIDSGIFRMREEEKNEHKKQRTCKNCKSRI
jgi:protein-tyrosine-phosphatase